MQNDNFFQEGYGSRIKHERTKLDLTQEEIAEKCGITRVQWGKYEREILKPSKKVSEKMNDLGMDMNYIHLADTNNKQSEKDNLESYPFTGDYNQLKGTERRLYEMAHARDWVEEAEKENHPIKLHPALKEMLISAVAVNGLSQAGIFNLIDGLALFAKNGESIFIDE